MSEIKKTDEEVVKVEGQETAPDEEPDDVEGHELGLSFPIAREIAKDRQREIARDVERHSLLAAAKAHARRKR